ncbi:hypothetical protein [Methanolapillus ohkumae]
MQQTENLETDAATENLETDAATESLETDKRKLQNQRQTQQVA